MTEEQLNKWFWCFRGWCDGVRSSNILHKHIFDLVEEAENGQHRAGVEALRQKLLSEDCMPWTWNITERIKQEADKLLKQP
jgi:hypothetical protein